MRNIFKAKGKQKNSMDLIVGLYSHRGFRHHDIFENKTWTGPAGVGGSA
jgi:hypothetical protein